MFVLGCKLLFRRDEQIIIMDKHVQAQMYPLLFALADLTRPPAVGNTLREECRYPQASGSK